MRQKKVNRVALLLHWAGEQKSWLFLAVFLSAAGGLCIVVPYMGIYQLMDALPKLRELFSVSVSNGKER